MAHEDEFVDVLIVGAGLSGIGAACHLQRRCPGRSVAILEAREALGGTWDLFRYPGVRSDSDMYTLGYAFRPWTGDRAIAGGPAILQYLQDTAREQGIERLIRYRQRVRGASWSSADAEWTVEVEQPGGEVRRLHCLFLLLCGGYYDYEQGHVPDFPGLAEFNGRVVHPQHWTDDVAYADRRVVVVGSGATAVTLVPALAERAAHVTLLQRSPGYLINRPSVDPAARWLRRGLGVAAAHGLMRWKNLLLSMYAFSLCRRKPALARDFLLGQVRQELGPGCDVATHFTPGYNPWEQRLCLVPDGDLFEAIRARRVSIATDRIERFTPTGLRLASGAELPADLVVMATGLKLKTLGGLALRVDGLPLASGELVNYRGVMFAGVPNLAFVFGYTNASWTLKADLAAVFVCRLLRHMQRRGLRRCVPRLDEAAMPLAPWTDFSSGYFRRALAELPRQGTARPWKLNQDYLSDLMALRWRAVDDGILQFA